MKILLYGLNYAPELTGIGKYSSEMCTWLAGKGNEVRAVCAPPYYPEWRIGGGYSAFGYRNETLDSVELFRCPIYVPKTPKTISRLLHLGSFALSSLPVLFGQWNWKPDVVIVIEPTLFCTPGALLFGKLRGSRSVLHIQDFELDAMLGLGMAKGDWIAKLGQSVERFFMRRYDAVSTISYSMLEKAGQKSGQPEKLFYFPNWVDTRFLTPDADPAVFRRRWNIEDTTRVILYSGNMGSKQGLEIVLQAADRLRDRQDVLFLIVGNGAAQKSLLHYAKLLQLPNLRFYPLQAYSELPALMNLADIHLVIQKKGAADAVLPSKLTTILSVGGHCIITAEAETELGLLCKKFPGIAECIEPENQDALLNTLNHMLNRLASNQRPSYNGIARQFALENLEKNQVLNNLLTRLVAISKQPYSSVNSV